MKLEISGLNMTQKKKSVSENAGCGLILREFSSLVLLCVSSIKHFLVLFFSNYISLFFDNKNF